MIKKLQNNDIEISGQIYAVFQLSYAVEAELLEANDFPTLKRPLESYLKSSNGFYGYFENNELARVIEVEGKIIKKMPFGVFVDIGEKFLTLLEIIEMVGLNYGHYQSNQQFNIGDRVKGTVGDFTDNPKQMRITQKTRKKA